MPPFLQRPPLCLARNCLTVRQFGPLQSNDPNDAMILPHGANPDRMKFSERTGLDRPNRPFKGLMRQNPVYQSVACVDSASKSILCIGLCDCGRLTVEASEVVMSEQHATLLKKARERLVEDRRAFANIIAAPFERKQLIF